MSAISGLCQRLVRFVPGIVLISIVLPAVQARSIHYDAVDHPGLAACDALAWKGDGQGARRCYLDLAQTVEDPAILAELEWALGNIQSANSLFRSAAALRPGDTGIRLRWGELFMQTYQYQDAYDLFTGVLAQDADNAYARVGVARALAEQFASDALKYLSPVLDDDSAQPGALLQARLLMAKMTMERGDWGQARGILGQAMALADRAGLPRLEIYALYAALDLLTGKQESEWTAKALAEHPAYGDIHAIPGYFFWISRRYREAVDLYQKAIAVQADHWHAHMELGINLLRNNRVAPAREHLQIAYAGDPYHPKTVNTLRLLDTFADYNEIHLPSLSADADPGVILRLHKEESAVLLPYVGQLARQGLKEFADRYRFRAQEPVVIEMYPHHDDFVVRTIGMPGLGILGAAFGYLLAMDSPSAHPDHEYHWGSTLWHEMAHVYTLEATRHLVPRWFSEGISVFEEWRYGPAPGRRMPLSVYEAIKAGTLLPIAELDQGFLRPAYPQQVIVSYMQAGLVCEFIEREYGFGKIVALLDEFSQGTDTREAMEKTFAVSVSTFDEAFHDFIDDEFGDLPGQMDSWKRLHEDSVRKFSASDWEGAIASATQAIALFPDYVEGDSPYLILARAYANTGEEDKQLAILRQYRQRGGYHPLALKMLADQLYRLQDLEESIAVLQSINLVAPFDVELHTVLGDRLLEAGRAEAALNEYLIALAMAPHDLASVHYRLARANHALGQADAVRRHLLSALEIAPHYRPAQKLLLETTQTRP